MKLIALTEEALAVVKNPNNRTRLKNFLLNNKHEKWLEEFSQIDKPYLKTKINIDNFEFDMSSETPLKTDFENSKRLFLALKNLSETQASDERLWAGLALNQFYNYMNYRWPIDEKKSLDYRYFKNENRSFRRTMFYQGLSRLWWIAKLTYDENLYDPFMYTKYVFENMEAFLHFADRNISNSRIALKSYLNALNKFKIEKKEGTSFLRERINPYISMLGGIYLIDSFTVEELTDKIYNKMIEIYNEREAKKSKEKFKIEG